MGEESPLCVEELKVSEGLTGLCGGERRGEGKGCQDS